MPISEINIPAILAFGFQYAWAPSRVHGTTPFKSTRVTALQVPLAAFRLDDTKTLDHAWVQPINACTTFHEAKAVSVPCRHSQLLQHHICIVTGTAVICVECTWGAAQSFSANFLRRGKISLERLPRTSLLRTYTHIDKNSQHTTRLNISGPHIPMLWTVSRATNQTLEPRRSYPASSRLLLLLFELHGTEGSSPAMQAPVVALTAASISHNFSSNRVL